jgi:serine phosphatase RsbU (regulator of sigma subunit)
MKNLFLLLSTIIIYIVIVVLMVSFLDLSKARRFLYTFPNGYIANTDIQNNQLLSFNLTNGEKLPEMNLEIDDSLDESIESNLYSVYRVFYDFIIFFVISIVFYFSSVWFFLLIGDILISTFFIDLSFLFTSSIFILGFDSYHIIFYFCFFTLPFIVMHLSFRLKGKDLTSKWLVPEIALAGIMTYIGYIGNNDPRTFSNILIVGFFLYLLSGFGIISVVIYDLIKYSKYSTSHLIKKAILSSSIFILIMVPSLIIYFELFKEFPNLRYLIYSIFITFPIFFAYGSMRYSFIKQQLYFNSTVTLFFLSIFIISIYIIILKILQFMIILPPNILDLFNGIYLTLSLFYASSIKNLINEIIEYYTFNRNSKFTSALEEMASTIASPMTMKSSAKQLLLRVNKVLNVDRVIVLVPAERFPDVEFKDISVMKIPETSPVWEYFSNNKDITITSYLIYGSGNREDTHKFLRDLNVQIAYPMLGLDSGRKVSSVFLIGEKKNNKNFSLGELKFIKEVTRLADLIIQNYLLLLSEVEKKKMERDLITVQIMQKTVNPLVFDSERIEDLEFGYISIPAVGISGDYMDFIKTPDNRLWIFLGDVSGHGVGSGFLVSAIKALVQDQILQGLDLQKIFANLNTFLLERYAGNEFMSLFAGIYDPRTSIFEYINAGHISPVVFRGSDYRFKLRGGDRLLGVLPTTFSPEKVQFSKKDRLFLYSDGVTETFNSAEKIYGEPRLLDFIKNNYSLESDEMVKSIVKDIEEFRKEAEISDDISLVCLTKII